MKLGDLAPWKQVSHCCWDLSRYAQHHLRPVLLFVTAVFIAVAALLLRLLLYH
jgi:hypothetical protein